MEWEETEDQRIDVLWNSLDNDTKMDMFYAVVKRLVQSELKDRGTYRWALYDVFGFGLEAYEMGLRCGFMNLHNAVYTKEDIEALLQHKMKKHLENPSFDERPVAEFSPGFTVGPK